MQKKKLTSFIDKYYLNGIVNSVILNSKSSKISTQFISSDKTLMGVLEMDKWTFEDAEVGVYSTDQLLKLLSVLDEDINISITKAGDKSISLKLTDSISAAEYVLSDTSIINKPPALKSLPQNFELKIDMTPSVMRKFIKGKAALPETDNFTIITDGSSTKIVIGHSTINTNRVTIPVTTTESADIDNLPFNANIFKEVLGANIDCESATLEVSSEGLARITFNIDDTSVTYYLVSIQDLD
tara:strand:- start:408 stop:1130 length:723 start_codon:yes stop_codon:yes gene_type:complete